MDKLIEKYRLTDEEISEELGSKFGTAQERFRYVADAATLKAIPIIRAGTYSQISNDLEYVNGRWCFKIGSKSYKATKEGGA